MWWLYFDVVALVSARRLARAEVGREQNEMARDSYSLLHFPMVAGIVLVALGMKKTIGDVSEPLDTVPAFALVGGLGVYLLALVAFRYRHVHSVNRQRLGSRSRAVRASSAGRRDTRAGRGGARDHSDVGDDRLRDGGLRRGPDPPATGGSRPRRGVEVAAGAPLRRRASRGARPSRPSRTGSGPGRRAG